MEKSELFKKELNYIKDEKIRNSAKIMIDLLPNYFFEIEASSTGKYHPEFTLGKRGLIRHVKATVKIAKELFEIYKFDDETKDLIFFALLIHDGLKKGLDEQGYTVHNHPLLIAKHLKENKDKLELTDEQVDRIAKMVASHMGKWTKNQYAPGVVLPLPKTVEEKFVHMCDYISSRKFLDIHFDEFDNILE